MHDDLLHAQASVDWAVSKFPIFQRRLDRWLKTNVNVVVRNLPPDIPYNHVVAVEKEPLPLSFNVEAGAYVNAIRSSLDILSCTLARRYCPTLVDDAYFPVAHSAAEFSRGNYKGHKFVKSLPIEVRDIIISLDPYKGGNRLLFSLHMLDIYRKHQRLLGVYIHPAQLRVSDIREFFADSINPETISRNGEAVMGRLTKGTPQPQFQLTAEVSFYEPGHSLRVGVIASLRQFASFAYSVIRLFDET